MNEDKLPINFDLFKYDTLIFDSFDITDIAVCDEGGERLNVHFENFPYVGIWTPRGPFICVEPWFGIADFKDTNHKLEEKRGINRLSFEEVFNCSYSINV